MTILAALFTAVALNAAAARAPLYPEDATWSLSGQEAGEQLGHKAAWVGDVNGDGIDDFLIGAPGWRGGRGRALLFFGSANGLRASADLQFEGENAGDQFGEVVAGTGDVDGDGLGDFVVSAVNFGGHGKVYFYLGGGSPRSVWSSEGKHKGEAYGDCAAPAGDLNGDGHADFLVGAFGYDHLRGRAELFLGGAMGPRPSADWGFKGEGRGEQVGYGIGPAGDLNGDGLDDLILGGKFHAKAKVPGVGKAYLFRGAGQGAFPKLIWSGWGEGEGATFGQRVDSAGDVNGDGFGDIIIGASGTERRHGAAYVLAGGKGGPRRLWKAAGPMQGADFGYAVASAGDLDGDGLDDLLVGSVSLGKVQAFLGGSPPSTEAVWTASASQAFQRFGSIVGSAGDLNADGLPDLFVCSEAYSGVQERVGKVDVYYHAPLPGVFPCRVQHAKGKQAVWPSSVVHPSETLLWQGSLPRAGRLSLELAKAGAPFGKKGGKSLTKDLAAGPFAWELRMKDLGKGAWRWRARLDDGPWMRGNWGRLGGTSNFRVR